MPIEDFQKILAKSIWVVIRNLENPEEDLKEKLSGWNIVNLNYPLRTSKTTSKKVKESGAANYPGLGNEFNDKLEVIENMPSGPQPLIIPSSEGTYRQRLQHVLNTGKS